MQEYLSFVSYPNKIISELGLNFLACDKLYLRYELSRLHERKKLVFASKPLNLCC